MLDELLAKLWEKTVKDEVTGCWLWTGGKQHGYGTVRFNYEILRIHRASAAIHLGLILSDSNSQALHKPICPNKNCWNPEHLYIGSPQDNIKDTQMSGKANRNAYKTHCISGHEFTFENTSLNKDGSRSCRECARLRMQDKRRRRT